MSWTATHIKYGQIQLSIGQKSVRYQTLGTSLVDGEQEFLSSDLSDYTIIHRERNISKVVCYVNGTPPVKVLI